MFKIMINVVLVVTLSAFNIPDAFGSSAYSNLECKYYTPVPDPIQELSRFSGIAVGSIDLSDFVEIRKRWMDCTREIGGTGSLSLEEAVSNFFAWESVAFETVIAAKSEPSVPEVEEDSGETESQNSRDSRQKFECSAPLILDGVINTWRKKFVTPIAMRTGANAGQSEQAADMLNFRIEGIETVSSSPRSIACTGIMTLTTSGGEKSGNARLDETRFMIANLYQVVFSSQKQIRFKVSFTDDNVTLFEIETRR